MPVMDREDHTIPFDHVAGALGEQRVKSYANAHAARPPLRCNCTHLLNGLDCPVHGPMRGGTGDQGHQADLRENGDIAENAD